MWSDFTEWKGKEIKVIRVGATREVQDQNHLLCLVSMQVYNMHGEHLRYSTSVSELGTCLQVRAGQNVSLRDGGKKYGKKERNRESLSRSFRTAYTRALTGSARGKACGQALAGSLGPRGTARAPTILKI